MTKDLFQEYDIVDKAVKGLMREMPVDKGEMLYYIELRKQTRIHLLLMGLGFSLFTFTMLTFYL